MISLSELMSSDSLLIVLISPPSTSSSRIIADKEHFVDLFHRAMAAPHAFCYFVDRHVGG